MPPTFLNNTHILYTHNNFIHKSTASGTFSLSARDKLSDRGGNNKNVREIQ